MAGTAAELTPRSYGDLLELYLATPEWEPADPASQDCESLPIGNAAGATDQDLDTYHDRQIAEALSIDVLGQREDGSIEAYSSHLRRTVQFKGLSRLKYPDLLQLFGTPVRRAVLRTSADEVPDMFPISEVREALGHLASRQLIGDETKLGVGCWPVVDSVGRDLGAVVLVNSSEAMHYNGSIDRITHPRHHGHLLNFEAAEKPWYEFERLAGLLEQANDTAFRAAVVDDLVKLFGDWRWQGGSDPIIVAGLVLATWVQSLWPWRPRIDVLGGTNTGKSMLCKALNGLFGNLAILTSDTTAAGLRQKICNSAAVVIVDEVDAKNKSKMARQREILEMLRSASRGTVAIRGSGGGRAVEFTLRHLVWVAGISLSYDDQADSNRAVRLNLLPPTPDMAGKLVVPSDDVLGDLGQRSLAVALWCVQEARELAGRLKIEKIQGVDQRAIESYSVPAAVIATVLDWAAADPVAMLRDMTAELSSDPQIESDEAALIREILSATVQLQTHRLNVSQAVRLVREASASNRDEWRQNLERYGVKLFLGAKPQIGLMYQIVRKALLTGTRWADQPIDQYLRRIEGREVKQIRCGEVSGKAVLFDLYWFAAQYMGSEITEEEESNATGF